MSLPGHELKSQPVGVMSALPLNGDIVLRLSNVSLGPTADSWMLAVTCPDHKDARLRDHGLLDISAIALTAGISVLADPKRV
jgi:hypothetical protein